MEPEHPRILVSVTGPRTNPLQILKVDYNKLMSMWRDWKPSALLMAV